MSQAFYYVCPVMFVVTCSVFILKYREKSLEHLCTCDSKDFVEGYP